MLQLLNIKFYLPVESAYVLLGKNLALYTGICGSKSSLVYVAIGPTTTDNTEGRWIRDQSTIPQHPSKTALLLWLPSHSTSLNDSRPAEVTTRPSTPPLIHGTFP